MSVAGDPPRIPSARMPGRRMWSGDGGRDGRFGRAGIDSGTSHWQYSAMPDDDRYSLTELADLAGVTPRTVRYYLAQGLLPAVGQSGPGSKYGDGHLAGSGSSVGSRPSTCRWRRSGAGSTALDDDGDPRRWPRTDAPAPPTGLRARLPALGPRAAASAAAPATGRAVARPTSMAPPRHGLRAATPPPSPPTSSPNASANPAIRQAPRPSADATPPAIERSQWERIALAPDVELHIRRPLTRAQQKAGRPPRDDRP